jgi:putative flippase GtrA
MRSHTQSPGNYFLFAIGGFVVFIGELLVTIILTELFGLWVMYSYAIALIIGLFFLFMYHTYVTFHLNDHSYVHLTKFGLLYLFVYLLSWDLVLVATKLGYHYLLSITLISFVLSLLSYKANKKWVFVEEKNEKKKE